MDGENARLLEVLDELVKTLSRSAHTRCHRRVLRRRRSSAGALKLQERRLERVFFQLAILHGGCVLLRHSGELLLGSHKMEMPRSLMRLRAS